MDEPYYTKRNKQVTKTSISMLRFHLEMGHRVSCQIHRARKWNGRCLEVWGARMGLVMNKCNFQFAKMKKPFRRTEGVAWQCDCAKWHRVVHLKWHIVYFITIKRKRKHQKDKPWLPVSAEHQVGGGTLSLTA